MRGPGVTLFGAIGPPLREATFMLGAATSQEEFLRFLRGLQLAKRDPDSRPFLVMDNAGAHHSDYARAYLNRHFIPLFQPGYSSCFNSTETVWALVKSQFVRRITRLALQRDYTVQHAKFLIQDICRGLPRH